MVDPLEAIVHVLITLGKLILEFSGTHFLVTYSQEANHRGDDVDDES